MHKTIEAGDAGLPCGGEPVFSEIGFSVYSRGFRAKAGKYKTVR
jgi:hypothetical protein